MITLMADSDSKGSFVSVRYHKDDPSQFDGMKITLMWLDYCGCQLTTQYGVNYGDFETDHNKKLFVIGVDEV